VEGGEGMIGLFTLNDGMLQLYYKSLWGAEWQHERIIPLPELNSYWNIVDAIAGYILLKAIPRDSLQIAKHESQYFTLNLKTFLVEALCVTNQHNRGAHLYASFPSPFSLPSIWFGVNLIFFKVGIRVFFMCSCILLILVGHFCLVHHSTQFRGCHHAHMLIHCLVFIRGMPSFCILMYCLDSWSNRQCIDDYCSIVQHVSANQHISLPTSVLTFNSQILYITGMQSIYSLHFKCN
jgi:hypothetical protein